MNNFVIHYKITKLLLFFFEIEYLVQLEEEIGVEQKNLETKKSQTVSEKTAKIVR